MSELLDAEIIGELVRARRCEDGQRVRTQRQKLKFTQAQLAELTGIRVSSISRIESGTYTPTDEHKVRLAASLFTEVADLWHPLQVKDARERALAAA